MRIKQGFWGCLLIGAAAGILRAFEYLFTIDYQGYYLPGPTASLMSGILTGLLAVGVLWSLFCGIALKGTQGEGKKLIGGEAHLRPYFTFIGIVTIAIGVARLFLGTSLSLLSGAACIIGGIGWWIAGKTKEPLKGAALLPVLYIVARIMIYFWQTYKFIHISGYILETLALCSQALLTLLVMKLLAGADVSRERLTRAALWAILLTPAANLAPLINLFKGIFSAETIFSALFALAYMLMSIQLLSSLNWRITHPEEQEQEPEEYPEIPATDDAF